MKARKITAIVLALVMMLALFAGCGKSQPASSAPAAAPSGSTGSAPAPAAADSGKSDAKADFKPVTWKLSYNAAAGQPMDVALIEFAENVKARTEGRVNIELFGNNILGPDTSTSEMAVEGTVQMIAIGDSFCSKFAKALSMPAMSFLFPSREDMMNAYLGEWGETYVAKPLREGYGLKLIDVWPQAERMMICTKPVTCLADLQGVKIRVPSGIPLYDACWTASGAMTTSLALEDAFTGMQQGVVDAVEMPLDFIYNYRFMEVAKYVTETRHIVYGQLIMANQAAFDQILPEDQEIIIDEVKKAGVKATEMLDSNIDTLRQDMIDNYDVTFIPLTEEQRNEFRDAVTPLFETYMDEWGRDAYDALMESFKK